MSAVVDTSKFNAAFKQYLRITSRTMVDALNGKMRDWMFKAAEYGPFNAEASPGDYARNRSQAYITHKTKQRYGENPPGSSKGRRIRESGRAYKRKGNTLGPGQVWNMVMRNKVARRLRKRHSGLRGYMASAFIRTALKFAKTGASKVAGKRDKIPRTIPTGGVITPATPARLVAMTRPHWAAKNSDDARKKESLAMRAVQIGFAEVLNDMINHTAKKMREAGKAVSA